MANKSIKAEVGARIFYLAAQGWGADRILKDGEVAAAGIARTTVVNYIKRWQALDEHEKRLDRPVVWERITDFGIPMEHLAFLLQVWRVRGRHAKMNLPRVREVLWWYRLHMARPDFTPRDVQNISVFFTMEEDYRNVGDPDADTAPLWTFIAHESSDDYFEAVNDGRVEMPKGNLRGYLIFLRAVSRREALNDVSADEAE